MARNPQDVNPEDAFPRRNLPDEAEKWGRSMEDRVVALEKAILGQAGSIQGTNRNLASSLSNLGTVIQTLSNQVYPVTFDVFETSAGGVDGLLPDVSESVVIPEGGYSNYLVLVTLEAFCTATFTGSFPRIAMGLEVGATGNVGYGPSVTATGGKASAFTSRFVIGGEWEAGALVPGETIWVAGTPIWLTDNTGAIASNNAVDLRGVVLFYK